MRKLKSFKRQYVGFNFNSNWELVIFKRLSSIIPNEFLPIKVNERLQGSRLELDIYIPKIRLAFELQGPTHFHLVKTIYNDLRKAAICKLKGIDLYYLSYVKYYGKQYFRTIFKQYKKNGTHRRNCD